MRCACIDIGSNTTRLLVADRTEDRPGPPRLTPVLNERAFTRIGATLDADGRIPTEKLSEVVAVVAAQTRRARALGAETIRCVATAAVRHAANGDSLVELLSSGSDPVPVVVLSGEDEARFAFRGAAETLAPADGSLGVVDVGGGSSELAVGAPPDRVRWWTSLALGSGSLTKTAELSDPPAPAELERVRTHVREALGDVHPPAADTVVAVGGSATSLRVLIGDRLDGDACRHALHRLASAPAAALAPTLGLDTDRVRLLPAGLLILHGVADCFDAPLLIGHGGLREGVLLSL